ncbi:MAG TPA: endonuclease/exonuclease/phosphatase family protein [Caulobacteraceae bacterium]|nr:endonuclease/exonuclease/phosphatase family protein [Caulobacteraceae bacterium]
MRIATLNINDVGKRLDDLLAWLAETEPDVVCLQELKAERGRHGALVGRGGGVKRGRG